MVLPLTCIVYCDAPMTVARMRASDADTVEDLVQATFISAFQSAGKFRGDRAIGWLYGIAANHVRAYARREIRRNL